MAWDRWEERERGAYAHAMRAVELDPADPLAHFILGRVLLYRRDFAKGEHHLARAEALNPNDADMQTQLALTHCVLGRPERGREAAALAARLNPFHDDWYFAYAAMPEFFLGDYEAAIALGRRAPEIAADMDAYRAAAEAHLGRMAEARAAIERFRAKLPRAHHLRPRARAGRAGALARPRQSLRAAAGPRPAARGRAAGGARGAGGPAAGPGAAAPRRARSPVRLRGTRRARPGTAR